LLVIEEHVLRIAFYVMCFFYCETPEGRADGSEIQAMWEGY